MCRVDFVDLHHHTEWSRYDGNGTVLQGVQRAVELGQPGLGCMDHGTMAGAIPLYKACKEANINSAIGVEAYFQIVFNDKLKYFHISLIAINNIGYANLCRMMSESAESQVILQKGSSSASRGYIPVVTLEQFEKYNEGVIILSGCIGGPISQYLLRGKADVAEKLLQRFDYIFGDRFYLEVMPHPVYDEENGSEIQAVVNAQIVDWAEKYRKEIVLTNDTHLVDIRKYSTYCKMWDLAGSTMVADYSQRYMQTSEDLLRAWKTLMGTDATRYMENSVQIASQCSYQFPFEDMRPQTDWGEPAERKLLRVAVDGLKKKGLWDWDDRRETFLESVYAKRLIEEWDVIRHTGYSSYFLTVLEYLEFAKERDIRYTARGSVCGSLLAYATGMSHVDAVRWGTHFWRFMHKAKKVDPDVDMDTADNRRSEIFNYILQQYEGKALPISSFQFWTTRSLVNELVKTYEDMPADDRKKIKDCLIGLNYDEAPVGYEALMGDPVYGAYFQIFEEKYPEFIVHFCGMHGQFKQFGQHAAGIAIVPEEYWNYFPSLRALKSTNGDKYSIRTAYDKNLLEWLGVMKFDVLGVKELRQLHEIEKATGVSYSDDLLNDPEIYKWFREGKSEAIFQNNSAGAKRMNQRIGIENIFELRASVAMNRPGPYQSGLFDKFMAGKKGEIDTNLPWYEICKETYGAFVYQEDAMLIAMKLAGMDWLHTDKFVKGISKKKFDPALEKEFIEGLQTVGGLSLELAQEVYEAIKLYSFNKAHATGYALLAAYAMWFKIHYTAEFYCAALKSEDMSNKGKEAREELEAAAIRDGVGILPANVNGGANYRLLTLNGKKYIQQGLCVIDGVGDAVALAIEQGQKEAPYEDMGVDLQAWQEHFKERGIPGRVVNVKVLNALLREHALNQDPDWFLGRAKVHRAKLLRKYQWRWEKFMKQVEKEEPVVVEEETEEEELVG